MATINTPAAGVSPYQAVAAAPTVLRAAADGTTVLATAAAASATVSELAATNANTLVVVTGQAALNSLITSSQPGVFDGANVTINLEEQNFTTTNQVTSTTNYPAGNTGEIQYNSGSNSFASSAFFTFTSGNVVTPGIRTDGYFYANGSPFLGGGSGNYSNSNVASFLAAFGSNVVSTTGNITGGNIAAQSGNIIDLLALNVTTVNIFARDASGINLGANGFNNLVVLETDVLVQNVPLSVTGNITAGNLDAVNLVINRITSDDSTFVTIEDGVNVNGEISATGNITGNYFIGNGSQLTGIIANTGNVTFSGEIVIGTGTSNLISGLYLAPSSSSANANMYLRVRGNIVDEPTHIHFDTGNNAYYNQFIGDDNKYIQLANTGNIVINSNDLVGNAAQWTFDTTGNLTFPTGNLVIISDYAAEANAAAISSTDHVLALLSTGVNGGVQSVWVEDVANIGTSNTAAVRVSPISQIGNVQIQTGNNSSINTWTFGTTGVLTLPNADASGFGNIYFEENSSTITFGLDDNAVPFLYSFATSGITLPKGGATIRDTAGNAVAFGRDAAATGPQGNAAVAIGQQAGDTSQGASAVAIGYQAGLNTQGASAVAIGADAGNAGQGAAAVAIGNNAGQTTQGINAIAIGASAGFLTQGNSAVAIGQTAGNSTQGEYSAAFGYGAGANAQGLQAVAIGSNAGADLQGNTAVAIGAGAGFDNQGNSAVAIGYFAGQSAQGNNSIIINATGNTLNQTTANTFTVAPVRNDVANIANIMFYNATTKEITYGNTISVTGNITGNYFIGNGSQLTSVAVPSQTILPTIQTITAVARSAGLFSGGQGGANVTVANTISVTEYGVIITAGTISETYKTGALGSIPGTVSLTFTTGLNSTQYTLYAYVTSNAGTYYSNAVIGTSGICLLAGTQIALSDGTHKAIEDITYTDKLLSWDFDRGCYAETTAMWIKRSETGSQYNLLTFSDGTTLRTFDQHRIFNKQAGAFTYPMTAATPVGTVTVNEHGQEITLTNKQMIRDTIEYYNVITDYHMNLFSDSVLTSCRFNNIYPITDMKFVKDSRTLRTRAEFENVPDRFFHGLRLAEQTTDIETVEWYVDRLLSTEVSTHAELAV
jgi:hypothetical protein